MCSENNSELSLRFVAGQNILGFQMCKGAGHLFAGDPRSEMERHYGPADSDQAWLDRRGEKVIRTTTEIASDS